MTKAYEDYCQTIAAETTDLTSKLQKLLRGDQSVTAEEINRQADQCFDRLDSAAAKYWADFAAEQCIPSNPQNTREEENLVK